MAQRNSLNLRTLAISGTVSVLAVTAALAAPAAGEPVTASEVREAAMPFRITAQPLSTALLEFSEQSEIVVTVPSDLIERMQAPAVVGRMSPTEALERLLSGSGLRYVRGSAGQITIVGAAAQHGALSGDRVRLAQADDRRSEGIGSIQTAQEGQRTPAGPPTQPLAEEAVPLIEEIIVTARKREESLLDVPISINAQTEAQIRNSGATTLEELANNVAGFSVMNLGPGQSQVAIRGVSAGQVVRDQPGVKEQVGIYLDDSVLSLSLFTPDMDLFDLQRVEVLRGPQGTLFGSGSISGTVRYITNKVNLEEFEFAAEATGTVVDGGELGSTNRFMINLPIAEGQVGLRAVGFFTRFAGFIDARQPGGIESEDVNDGERFGGRVAMEIRPEAVPGLSITPRLVIQNVNTDGFPRADAFNILGNPFATTRPAVDLGKREQFTQFEENFDDEFILVDATVEYDFGPVQVTGITSYIDRDILVERDATQLTGSITGQPGLFTPEGFPEEVFTLDAPLIDATSLQVFTQEARAAFNWRDRIEGTVGFFYSNIDRDYGQDLPVIGFEDLTGVPTAGVLAPKDVLFFSRIPFDQEQIAVFGDVTIHLTDRLDVSGGIRWFDFNEKRSLNFDGIFTAPTFGLPGNTNSRDISPRAIVSYAATDDITLSAQASKGFRLGGVNDPLNEPLCTPQDLITFGNRPSFEDEELWNYEFGAKGSFWGGRGSFNFAAFWNQIDNLQVTTDAGTCSSRIVFNVDDSRSIGLEGELTLVPVEGFEFGLSSSLIEAEFRSTVTSTDAEGNTFVVEGIEKGNRLPVTPRFQLSAHASYARPVFGDFEGFVWANFQHVSSRFTQPGDQVDGFGVVDLTIIPIGDPSVSTFTFNPRLPNYQIGNLRFGLRSDLWEFAFFVNNLWDQRALLSLDRERGTLARVGFQTNPPRTFGLTARMTY